MKLKAALAVLIGTVVLACSTAAPAPVEPTPNIDATVEVEPTPDIDATVEARLAHERAVDATVESRLREEKASQSTVQVKPTDTPVPQPTNTPKPAPTNTPTVVPTATTVPTRTPTATPTRMPTPSSTPVPGYALYINDTRVYSGDLSVAVPYGTVDLHQLPGANDTYRKNSWVNLSVTPTNLASAVRLLGGFQTISGTSGSIYMDNTKWVTISITPPVPPTLVPTPTIIPSPTSPPSPTSTPSPNPSTSQNGGDCDYQLIISDGDNGLSVRFKIGTTWANETLVWQQGAADILNLTVSSARIPYHSNSSWNLSLKAPAVITRFSAQNRPPHVVLGSANASPGTPVTAWIGGEEVASTNCN